MTVPGPPPKTSDEQRRRVVALVDAGGSYSAVAAEVFGDARLRGRVERIVRRQRHRLRPVPTLDELLDQLKPGREEQRAGETQSSLTQLVPLFAAMLRRRLEADLPVNGRELLALAELERRLEAERALKRINALVGPS